MEQRKQLEEGLGQVEDRGKEGELGGEAGQKQGRELGKGDQDAG